MQLGWPGVGGRLRSLAYFAEAGVLAHELRRSRVQHVHNHFANSSCSVALIAVTMCGVGFSITIHGPAIFFEPKKWHIDRKVHLAKFVACISYYCRSQAMIFARVSDWDKMHIVRCGVDPGLFERRVHTESAVQVLWVGRLAAVKGLPILLDAWARVSKEYQNVRLKLVGNGPDRSMLERQIEQLGIAERVSITGYLSQSEVRAELQRTDLFVMPSFAEGVPVVLMEAMAAGIPVVATRIAGVGELVEDRSHGLLVPPGNCEALAAAMLKLLGDRSLRQQFGDSGRAKVASEFNGMREAEKLLQLFSQSVVG
jgi:glycosyltransferase involved in cell wall biosynthesis